MLAVLLLVGCAPDITPMGVQECEMRETIQAVKYLRTQTAARIERTRRLRRQWRQEAAQVDTLAAFFNGVRPVFNK